MIKYKDIRIIKEKSSSAATYDNKYTFIDNINTAKTNDTSSTNIKDKVNGEQHLKITVDTKKEEKYKKKKVVGMLYHISYESYFINDLFFIAIVTRLLCRLLFLINFLNLYFDQILTSWFVDVTVRNLSMFCNERAWESISDDDTASETITG